MLFWYFFNDKRLIKAHDIKLTFPWFLTQYMLPYVIPFFGSVRYVIKSDVWGNLLMYIKGKNLLIQHYNSVSGVASFNTVDL